MIIALLGLTVFLSLDNKNNQLSFEEVNSKTTSGIQIITLLKLGLFGKDLRYEKVLSAMDIQLLSQAETSFGGYVDSQTNKLTLGVSLRLD